ncbi:transporter substrate-binding domain-containing protein [Streptomyces sp. NBC_00906]|uniref:transporter substrate-binding domain-containing protein n=1 Tax=Streptomyces sp. NBC_00906 TaxID=2903688 RepID=UPI00224FD5FC|nr:transporter substrate-binding domain-containing protein [Streptomyces sp. NBC_00906]MCX4871057.1 transporter substrate-binding domain-containing protein [Streptomyces sp. NBC_00906]
MHEEERPTHRLKARHSPLAGDTPQADELAEWLRARVNGRTLRQLEELFPFGRTQWSEFLKGRKLIPLWLLDSVVTKLVPPPEQQLHRGLGHELLRAAEEADAARLAAKSPDIPSGSTPHDYELRLDDARQGQIKAQETVQSLTHLIYVFISAMADLNQRCKDLEAERDQARLRLQEAETTANQQRAAENRKRAAEDQRLIARTEQRLAEAGRRHAEFEERLARARREQQEAEDLRIEAFQQAEQYRRAFRQLTGRDTPAGPDGEDPGSVPAPQPWEYDHFLETADAQLDAYNARLDAVREQIGSPVPPASQAVRTIPGQVVRSPSTDSADNTPTSGDPVHGPSADTADNDSATRTEGPAAMPENTGLPDRGDGPATGGAAHRPGRNRTSLRVAVAATTCLALLAGGGWLAWNHYRSDQDSLDSKAPLKDAYALQDSSTIQQANKDGEIKIGVKDDQFGLSNIKGDSENPDDWKGFDIEVARNIAEKLGFKKDRIKFVKVTTRTREQWLEGGSVDLIVGSYSITPKRKERVDFAGPYLTTDQGMMIYTEGGENAWVQENGHQAEKKIEGPEDFPDNTDVCTVGSSISEAVLKQFPKPKFRVKLRSEYQDCINLLNEDMGVQVVVTDRPILAGFLTANPNLAMVPNPLDHSTTKWGVGIRKNEPALRHFICESIAEQVDSGTWDALYKKYLKDTLSKENVYPRPPGEKERC